MCRGVRGERLDTTAGLALLEGGGVFLAALLHQQLTAASLSLSARLSL